MTALPTNDYCGPAAPPGKTPKIGAAQRLANTTLLIGYDGENRCVHINLLDNTKDGGWSLVSIQRPKYQRLGVRKLSVLMFGPNGRIVRQFYDEFSYRKKKKEPRGFQSPGIFKGQGIFNEQTRII
ncbi:MAG: hypothetical protein LBM92_04915 [Opitutaceae bacterium]|jgi:hypothetical protein|nr:hypothetical protein [Opitutaceae bacterium]